MPSPSKYTTGVLCLRDLVFLLAELTRSAFRHSLQERNLAGITASEADILPRFITGREEERHEIRIHKIFRDERNERYALVRPAGALMRAVEDVCGRRLQWLIEVRERQNDILEDRLYDEDLFEDYVILDRLDLSEETEIHRIALMVREKLDQIGLDD